MFYMTNTVRQISSNNYHLFNRLLPNWIECKTDRLLLKTLRYTPVLRR